MKTDRRPLGVDLRCRTAGPRLYAHFFTAQDTFTFARTFTARFTHTHVYTPRLPYAHTFTVAPRTHFTLRTRFALRYCTLFV